MHTALAAVAASAGIVALAAAAFVDMRVGVSAAAGGALATGNLWTLSRIIVRLLPESRAGAEAQSRAAWVLVASLKTTGLLAVAWLLMRHAVVAPLWMLVGFLSLPIGIAIGTLVSDRSAESEEPQ